MKQKKRIGIIIQARMGSTRLPTKVMMDLCDKPMLWHIIQRVKNSKKADEVIVATTTQPMDKTILDLCDETHIKSFAGSEDDVLDRYIKAARTYDIDTIVRITADCPLIDPTIIDDLIDKHAAEGNDYTSNIVERTFPRGLDAEIVELQTLEHICRKTSEQRYHEHVTLYIYTHPDEFKIGSMTAQGMYHNPQWRLTVDTKEDFELIKAIYERLYKGDNIIDNKDAFELLRRTPELTHMNEHVEQKKV